MDAGFANMTWRRRDASRPRAIITLADTAWNERIAEAARHSPALISIDHP